MSPRTRFVAAMMLLAALAGCAPVNVEPGTLTITEQGWTGWSKQQPTPSVTTVVPVVGQSLALHGLGGGLPSTVDAVGPDSVTVSVGGVAPRSAGGGLDLNGCGPQRFTIRRGESVKFGTCTMDAGTTWTLAYA